MEHKIKDISLAEKGRKDIQWVEAHMPVLMALREKAKKEKPLKGQRIVGCLHLEKKTAVLVEALKDAGAQVVWTGCNPLSTRDEIAAALVKNGISVFAWYGQTNDEFYWCIEEALKIKPTMTLDDGADLIFTVHNKHPELAKEIVGGTEETTTGVHRLRAMADDGKLLYPVIAVNDAETKWDFDNVYGTGQSTLEGIMLATNIMIAGKKIVVSGFGHCGRGISMRARGLGANVIVTEVSPINALKATLEGYDVMTMEDAAKIGDIFITATGMKDIIAKKHFEKMKDGAIVCNSGHYDCELNLKELESISEKRDVRKDVEEYKLKNGNRIFILAKGRLVNLAAGQGHPIEVMDMSFANQFLSMIRLAKEGKTMGKKVYDVSREQDQEIARMKLKSMGLGIDSLSADQEKYKTAYAEGT